ncbi:hypothetical protein BGZ94_008759, partial [Podila epigama]
SPVMDTADSNSRPPPLPAKLRWRPYANGNSLKVKKPKKTDIKLNSNPKAMAHKVRGNQYYAGGRTREPPIKVRLQWEEAETIESMREGGHPHNQHYHHHSSSSDSDSDISISPKGPRRTSTASAGSISSDTSVPAKASNSLSNILHRAISSLPSPTSSSGTTSTPLSAVDFVGGQVDFSLFGASLPALSDADLQNHDLPFATLASNTAYQIAMDVLFKPQKIPVGTTANTNVNTNGFSNTNNTLNTNANNAMALSDLFGAPSLHSLQNHPDSVMSNDDLLNVASIDELLTSCAFADPLDPTAQLLSPTTTNQSLGASSPMSSLVDFSSSSRISSPSSTSFSPLAISGTSFDALIAQPMNSISQPTQLSQQQVLQKNMAQQGSNASLTSSTNVSDPYVVLAQDLSSPFAYMNASSEQGTVKSPSPWPSLFPQEPSARVQPQSQPQRTEIATQTDGIYSPATSSVSGRITSLQETLGLSDDELDPDWLSFLDEAAPLLNEAEGLPSPPHSVDDDISSSATSPRSPAQREKNAWNWTDQLIKPNVTTSPTGHRTFSLPSAPMGNVGQIGSGGLIRTLNNTSNQSSKTSTSQIQGQTSATTIQPSASAIPNQQSLSDPTNNTSDNGGFSSTFGDLVSMIRNLWTSNDRGVYSSSNDNDKK